MYINDQTIKLILLTENTMLHRNKKLPRNADYSATTSSRTQPMYREQIFVATNSEINDGDHSESKKDVKIVDITIPGIDKIFDRNYSVCGKVLWILALLVSLMMCIYQTTILLTMYFRFAVSVDVSVSREHTIVVPAVTICPRLLSLSFLTALRELISDKCNKSNGRCPNFNSNSTDSYPFERMNFSLQELWNVHAIPEGAVEIRTPCGSLAVSGNHDERYEEIQRCKHDMLFKMKSHYQQTVFGTCLVLEPVDPNVKYQGPDTFIKLIINDTMIKKWNLTSKFTNEQSTRYSKLLLWLHNPTEVHRHDSVFLAEKLLRNYVTDIRFETKEYRFLNKSDQLCDNEITYSDCSNKCYDECLDRYVHCSFPFMITTKSQCANIIEAFHTYSRVKYFYTHELQRCQCSCKRACTTYIHTVNTDLMIRLDSASTVFYLYYPDNLYHIYTESYVYGTAQLLSDLVANVSFYLGFCALTFVQIIELCFRRKCDGRKQS